MERQTKARTRTALATGALLVIAVLGGCTTKGGGTEGTAADGASGAASGTTPIALAPQGAAPITSNEAGPDGCRKVSAGPYADVAHVPDPRGLLRRGGVLGEAHDSPQATIPGVPPSSVVDYPTVDDYQDPNVLTSKPDLLAAWSKLHYRGATAATWVKGAEHQVVTVTEFGSAAEAQQALVAHLTQLCPKATATIRRENGVEITRDTDSWRAIFVLHDTEISVYACPCSTNSFSGVVDFQGWILQTAQALTAPNATPG